MVTLLRAVLRASTATAPVRPTRAPLDSSSVGSGVFTDWEVMFTTRPKPRSIMPYTVAWISAIGAIMLPSTALRQSSSVKFLKSPGGGPPALLIRMSGLGQAASSALRPSSVVTSHTTGVTFTP